MTPLKRGAIAMGAAIALLLALRAVAEAHATLVSAEPAANSQLVTAPQRVRLVFSEEVDPALAQLSLIASDGFVRNLQVRGDPRDVRAVVAPVEHLPSGAYRVRWRVVSADGHPVEGSYVFAVGSAPVSAAISDSGASVEAATWGPAVGGAPVVPALLRGLGIGSLMALTGLLTFMSFRTDKGLSAGVSARANRAAAWIAVLSAILLGLYFVAWMLNASPTHRLGDEETTALLRSGVARVEELRVALALLALWALLLARRPMLALPLAAAAVLVSGAAGHSAAMSPIVAVPARAIHLLAGAAWLGGLIWLIAMRDADTSSFVAEAMRVSGTALWAVVLITLSGVIQLVVFLPSVSAFFTSAYGLVAMAKIAGLAALVAFGAYHRTRSLPRLTSDSRAVSGFARVLRAEVAVMALVILLGGWLAFVSPPHAAQSMSHMHM